MGGSLNMKLANVNNRKNQITHYIHSQIPTSVEWHKLTNWRNAEALYKFDRAIWESFKREGKIPIDVLMRVEKQEKVNEPEELSEEEIAWLKENTTGKLMKLKDTSDMPVCTDVGEALYYLKANYVVNGVLQKEYV